MICPKCGPDCGCRAVAALESKSECDQCDGSGVYFIDGDPQECICTGSQTQKQTNLGRIILRLAACIVSREEIIKALNSKKVEVERLRLENEQLRANAASAQSCPLCGGLLPDHALECGWYPLVVAELRAKVKRLRWALEKYADHNNWDRGIYDEDVFMLMGAWRIASKALE